MKKLQNKEGKKYGINMMGRKIRRKHENKKMKDKKKVERRLSRQRGFKIGGRYQKVNRKINTKNKNN